jgi:hypothetical protein
MERFIEEAPERLKKKDLAMVQSFFFFFFLGLKKIGMVKILSSYG